MPSTTGASTDRAPCSTSSFVDRVKKAQAKMVAKVLDLFLRNGALSFRYNKEPLLEYVDQVRAASEPRKRSNPGIGALARWAGNFLWRSLLNP
jgi:hypothetical protein